jgi:hypothetical protein
MHDALLLDSVCKRGTEVEASLGNAHRPDAHVTKIEDGVCLILSRHCQ